jgi:hypothetical protein
VATMTCRTRSLLALMAAFGLATPAPASEPAEPTLEVRIVPAPAPPRGPYTPPTLHTVPVARAASDPAIDGVFDDAAWTGSSPTAPLRAIRNAPPPDPRWAVTAIAAPGGLALRFAGLPADATWSLSVDPDGAKRGWPRLAGANGTATIQRCALRPEHASPPFPASWPVAFPPCDAPLPAQAAAGADGWEVLVPWSALGPTSDDLRIQAWFRHGDATGTLDAGGAATDYPTGGRAITLTGAPARSESLFVAWDRPASTAELTLTANGLTGPEAWRIEAHTNGRTLLVHPLTLEPGPTGAARATVTLPVHGHTGTGFVARQVEDAPLARGAWATPWAIAERATVATPVHRGTIEIRYNQTNPRRTTRLTVSGPDGEVLGAADLTVPGGDGSLFFDVPPEWPDRLMIALPGLFPEAAVPVLRARPSTAGSRR